MKVALSVVLNNGLCCAASTWCYSTA